jgi:beta-galactosidase
MYLCFEFTGSLIGVDNGDATCVESFQSSSRKAFNGMCLAIVKSQKGGGNIRFTAGSIGLKPFEIFIKSK